MEAKEFEELKQGYEKAKEKQMNLKGRAEVVKERVKKEYGFDTVEEMEAHIDELSAELLKMEAQFEKDFATLQKDFDQIQEVIYGDN